MAGHEPLARFADDLATVLPAVDARTTGQYGDGLGSENEEDQVAALLSALQAHERRYATVDREVAYPDRSGTCDLRLQDGTPVEAKLLRYWRANGDPEPHMYTHVFSPFNRNTLLTDARRVAHSTFADTGGLLGLFYARADDDPQTVRALPERFTAPDLADKVVRDIEYWYDIEAQVARIAPVEGLTHDVHQRGAVITWQVQPASTVRD
jgi:hypothetical protein